MKKQDVPSISKEDAEEFSESLGQIVTGSYRQILLADKMQVPQVLGFLSLRDWVNQKIGGYIKYTADERRKIADELRSDGVTDTKIADVLGVAPSTLWRDQQEKIIANAIHPSNGAALKSIADATLPIPEPVENLTEEERPRRKKSAADVEVELHRAADQGVEALVWDKVKDRFLPFWENLLNSLEEDERPFLIWAVHTFTDQYEEKRANQ